MYVVLRTGGKQYAVQVGQELDVEKLPAEVGGVVRFEDILAVVSDGDVRVGHSLSGAFVEARVLRQLRAEKVTIFKMRRRKHYQKHQGHRQTLTRLQVLSISA